MFRIAVCDDESKICEGILAIIEGFQRDRLLEIDTDIFYSGAGLYEKFASGTYYDLIFMDVEMPGANGIEVCRRIREDLGNDSTQIIFISGKNCYFRNMLEVNPMHFLDKPLREELVCRDLDRALRKAGQLREIFAYHQNRNICKIEIRRILYFKSCGREVCMVTTEGEEHFYEKLDIIEKELACCNFLRIHRTCLINSSQIKKYRFESVVMNNGVELSVSVRRRERIRKAQLREAVRNA